MTSVVKIKQNGFAHLLILLLLAGIGLGIYLVQHPAIFSPHADSDPGCEASDAYSFFLCTQRANDPADNLNRIEITKQIECTKLQDCAFRIRRGKNLTITGKENTAAGFKRTVNYNYPLLVIGELENPGGASGITLQNLIFDDTTAECNETVAENCNSPLVLWGLHNSTVDNITILHAKNNGIQIVSAFNLTIKNSVIYDSNTNGIWFDDARSCDDVIRCGADPSKISSIINIENNLIANSRVAAMEFYAYGQPTLHSRIKGNLIVHNHRDSKFIYCPKPDPGANPPVRGAHCPGGQVAVGKSQYLDLENNIIRSGRIETKKPNDSYDPYPGDAGSGRYYEDMGLHTSGLELSSHLQNIIFTKNKVYNNTGAGIFADYTYFNLALAGVSNNVGNEGAVQLTYNSLFNNGFNLGRKDVENLENVPGIYLKDNIFGDNLTIPKAFIFADPPICEVIDTTHCKTTVRWYSEDYPNISTMVSGINTNPDHHSDGNQAPDWIPSNGITFQLTDGGQVLASTFIRGTNPNPIVPSPSITSPIPTPSPSSPVTQPSPVPSPSTATPLPTPSPSSPVTQPSPPSIPSPTPAAPLTCGIGVHSIVYNNNLSRYYTTYEASIDVLLQSGWRDAGYQFWAYNSAAPGTLPVHSFYHLPGDATHQDRLLSIYEPGFAGLVSQGWVDEGAVFWALNSAQPKTIGIHSFAFRDTNSRYYTGDTNLFQPLIDQGWRDEGIQFWAYKNLADSCH